MTQTHPAMPLQTKSEPRPTTPPDRPTRDVAEAAVLLGVSPWLVLQQIAKGNLPHKRFGRRILIPRRAFLAWLEDVDGPARQV